MRTLSQLARRIFNKGTPAINVLRIAAAVASTETVTVGAITFEVSTGATPVTTGNVALDLSAAGTKATGTLTSDTTNVSDGDTVTIGSTVYRFKNTMAQAYDVKIGADAATTLANLKKAINATGTAGTDYFAGTLVHPSVSAGAITSTTLVVTALITGTAGNSIASTETSTHLSWGAATLASGANPTASQFADALVAAVNAHVSCLANATKISANEVLFVARRKNLAITVAETLAGSNNAWSNASAFYSRSDGDASNDATGQARSATTVEVALETMHFVFGFTVAGCIVQVRTSSGALKAWDGVVTTSGARVTLSSSGSTDIAATDVVCVIAW